MLFQKIRNEVKTVKGYENIKGNAKKRINYG